MLVELEEDEEEADGGVCGVREDDDAEPEEE